jgi:tRNA G18 (ribose-2'-O)-methylase SpoU
VPLIDLTDLDDPRLADYRQVREPREMLARGCFVAEGRFVVRRLLTASRFPARSLLVCDAALVELEDLLAGLPHLPVYRLPRRQVSNIVGYPMHQGCLALGERRPRALVEVEGVASGGRLVVVLERLGNPDNIGGIFRNADALGADGVILSPGCGDPLYRKAIRTSMAATLRLPWAVASAWPDALDELKENGLTLVALTPRPSATPLHALWPETGWPAKLALLVGAEGTGLSNQALALADAHARIPMAGHVDSLNLATAAAIALYECLRRR